MALIAAFKYHRVDNFSVSLDMLKLATKLLKTHVSQSFEQLLNLRSKHGEYIQPNLFRNPYLIKFFEQQQDFSIFLTEGGVEILSIIRELKVLHKAQPPPKMPLEIGISAEIKSAIKTLNTINKGQSNEKLLFRMKLKALVKGKDSFKVRHLMTRYATSAPMHKETRFCKEIQAPQD